MRPKKQVSLAIRILREKRDASARATHLEAANKKYLLTTNERKQMSTTTNFKRIALVAVAALGLGVLSSVPSNAAITGTLAVTATNGNATTALVDSTTAGSLKVRWLSSGSTDTVLITTSLNSKPTLGSAGTSLVFIPYDTATSIAPSTLYANGGNLIGTLSGTTRDTAVVNNAGVAGYASGTFLFQLDTTVGIVAGTYTYTITLTPANAGVAEPTKVVTQDVSIVVSALASNSTTAAPAYSTAYIGTTSVDSSTASDSTSLSFVATASATASGAIWVKLRNASNGAVETKDSLTVTIDKGNVGPSSGSLGKSIVLAYAPTAPAGGMQVAFYPDGSTGAATITIATKNAGTFTKTITWYGTAVKSIVASQYRSVVNIGLETGVAGANAKGAVKVNAYDANQTSYGAATGSYAYAYSSDTSVISDYGTACDTWNTTDGAAYCRLTGVKAGTATITIRDAATVALSTVASNAVTVRVSAAGATTVNNTFTLTTDKASYAPGEKGYLTVTLKDAAGNVVPSVTSAATVFASGGISTSAQLGSASDVLTGLTITTDRSSTPSSTDPIKVYTFYAPVTAGSLTFSAKGASTFSAASQATATTATITVADSASAALAAVSALAVTVASLKTLITTLTNLVLKIQKKVKA